MSEESNIYANFVNVAEEILKASDDKWIGSSAWQTRCTTEQRVKVDQDDSKPGFRSAALNSTPLAKSFQLNAHNLVNPPQLLPSPSPIPRRHSPLFTRSPLRQYSPTVYEHDSMFIQHDWEQVKSGEKFFLGLRKFGTDQSELLSRNQIHSFFQFLL
ncbi:hypothetical protein DdX_15650 [Ditylenchus destructor]|uniref:Uncharacterized protein n=1 Tax=Ditylenchus destructor TaxID=166010 RepID=A0AAD4MPX0_9BILA|nr:hypothetical protein DdX_15650 [Ditylenchus destructor]